MSTELQDLAKHARECQIARDNIDIQLTLATKALERIYNDSSSLADAVHMAKQALYGLGKTHLLPESKILPQEPKPKPVEKVKQRKERSDKGKTRSKPLF